MKQSRATRRRAGRPASGPGGEHVSKYPPLTGRIPTATKHRLEGLSALRGVPMWKLIDAAILAYIEQLPEAERRLLTQFSARREASLG